VAFLDTFKVPTSTSGNAVLDRELIRCIASTSLKTKLEHDLAEKISDAVVDSILCILPDTTDNTDDVNAPRPPVDLNMIEIMTMQRDLGSDSRFVDGLVLDHGGRHPDMPTALRIVIS